MKPDALPALAAFACVARHGSFTRAAAELGVSASALSQTLRGLEANLGVRLLNRSTRRVATTEHGAALLQRIAPALEALHGALDTLDEARGRPSGTLRINLARVAAQSIVMPQFAAFAAAYPELALELSFDEGFVDLVAGGFDAGIRLGESLKRDVIAVRVSAPQRLAIVGAPAYFARHPPPREPADLHRHRCARLRLAGSGALYRWEFTDRDGRDFAIDVDGPLIVNDALFAIEAVRQGAVLALCFESQVATDLARGTLVRVLEDWCPPFPGFYLYYPAFSGSRAQVPLKLRVFIDFLQARLA